jgi:hypothetical protein
LTADGLSLQRTRAALAPVDPIYFFLMLTHNCSCVAFKIRWRSVSESLS